MKQVLVVDDSGVIRKVARRILEGLKFQTAEAEDGQKGLDACSFLMPDAVIVDWNMPQVDGFEFVRELRRMPGGGRPKILFCLSESDVGQIARAMHLGADDYIMKPFDREVVLEKMQAIGMV